jgi:TRAP-type C4-dicarboxylate transport system permease small subunit
LAYIWKNKGFFMKKTTRYAIYIAVIVVSLFLIIAGTTLSNRTGSTAWGIGAGFGFAGLFYSFLILPGQLLPKTPDKK